MAHVFVDVSNVAGLRKGEPDHSPWHEVILVCEAWLERHPADSLVLLADWGFHGYLQHNFPDQFPAYLRAKDAKKVRLPLSGRYATLIEVPEGVAADEHILLRADRHEDRRIIAEDNYRAYRAKYAWLQGFELVVPMIEGEKVRFEARYLHVIDEELIAEAQAADADRAEILARTRDSRRNRHQRRRAASAKPAVTPSRERDLIGRPRGSHEDVVHVVQDTRRSAERPSGGRPSGRYWVLWGLCLAGSFAVMVLFYLG